jgi:molybdopterin-guanine dinucleotide biosynthesis protein A
MGRDKALLGFRGRTLIELALAKLRALELTPGIAGNRPDLGEYAPVIPDNFPGSGPLAGIEAALSVTGEDLNLFLPVDLPLLPVSFLRWMTSRARQTYALATIPYLQGHPQPLCAIYHRALLSGIRASLEAGDGKVMRVVQSVVLATGAKLDSFDVETVTAALSPVTQWSFPHRWFQNLNTPRDLEIAALEERLLIQ